MALLRLHDNAHDDYDRFAAVQWRQPSIVEEQFEGAIANNIWHFDYAQIETILWRSQVSESTAYTINSQTQRLLELIVAQLPKKLSEQQLQRLKILSQKSLPSSHGESFSELLIDYYFYQQEHQIILAELKTSQIDIRRLQEQYFGAQIASQLFSRKNMITDYLNARRIVNMDASLTATQKAMQLKTLQDEHRAELLNSSL